MRVERNDGLGALIASFNQMAATIQRQVSDLELRYMAARKARDAQTAEARLGAQPETIAGRRQIIDELSVPNPAA